MLEIIDEIKSDFRTEIFKNHPKMLELARKERRLYEVTSPELFEVRTQAEKDAITRKLKKEIEDINKEIEAIKTNAIYKNAFEWRFEFPEVLDNEGNFLGFDAVIGNPPYLQLSKTENLIKSYKDYLLDKFKTSGGRLNTFIFFIHQAFNLMKENGELAFIIPNTILTQEYYTFTREFLLNDTNLHTIINYDDLPFEYAIVETVSLFFNKTHNKNTDYFVNVLKQSETETVTLLQRRNKDFLKEKNATFAFNTNSIVDKTYANSDLLTEHVDINQAIALKGDKKLSLRFENSENKFYKLLDGRNINKYSISWGNIFLDYDLERIHSCKRKDIFESKEKLFFRRVSSNLIFTYDNDQYFALNTLVVINSKPTSNLNLKYLLSVLNSKLINYVYVNKFKSTKTVFSEIQANTVGQLPIKQITPEAQKPFIELVDEILEKKKLGEPTAKLENKIDLMVYRLYDLTDEEIKIVKGEK